MSEDRVRYAVVFTVADRKEKFLYHYDTSRGAMAATEAAMFEHSKAGHMLTDITAVKAVPA